MNHPFQLCRVDTLALMNSKRMIGRRELDGRPIRVRAQVNIRLEQKRVRVARDPVAQPPKVWAHPRDARMLEHIKIHPIVRLAQRGPDTPHEPVTSTLNGNLKAAADEKMLAVNGARVARERRPHGTLSLGNLVILKRRSEREVGNYFERLPASRASFLGHIWLSHPMRANAPAKLRCANPVSKPPRTSRAPAASAGC